MTIKRKLLIPALAAVVISAGVVACEQEGPLERAGEQIDETTEKAAERVEEATE